MFQKDNCVLLLVLASLILIQGVLCMKETLLPSIQEQSKKVGDAILQAGKGFSTDTQQISPATCYNMQISKKGNSESIIKLNEGSTYDNIVSTFGIDVTAKMSFAMFAAGASFNYLRSIQTTTSSFSITYYHLIQRDVALNFNSSGVLNEVGKMIYQDGNNDVFRLACGDQIVTSYRQRASLFFTFNLNFNNRVQKEIIQSKLGGSFGGIGSITAQIQKIATQNSISGSINLQVYQIGGDPRKISQIISSKDPDGNFYIVKCSFTDPSACNRTVSDLINYSSQSFGQQINFETQEGLSNFGNNNIRYISASYFGLKVGNSFVTQQVTDARLKLSNYMEQFQYYAQNLNSLLNGYPVAWDKSSQVFNFFQSQLSIAQGNVKSLLNVNNPEQGSLGCFSSPQRCVQIFNSIQQQLRQLDIVRINSYMQGQMKYTYKILSGVYLSGDSVYAFVPNNVWVPSNLVLIVDNYNFNATYVYHDHDAGWCTIKSPGFVWNNNRYEGTHFSYCQHYTGSYWDYYYRATSEYYFTLFRSQQVTQQEQKNQKKRGSLLKLQSLRKQNINRL